MRMKPSKKAKNVKQRAIPMEKFGRDHWSTFAYVETLVVDGTGEPRRERMRCDANRHPFFAHAEFEDKFPTRTKKGEVKNHDDWDCLDDCELVGLVKNIGTELNRVYKLTALGWTVVSQLRQHKANGGNFHGFVPKI